VLPGKRSTGRRALRRSVASALAAAAAAGCSLLSDTSGFWGGKDDVDGSPDGTANAADASPDGPAAAAQGDAAKSAYVDAVLADQPIAYFHLDEADGSVCNDALKTLTCITSSPTGASTKTATTRSEQRWKPSTSG
jgi:hypothetical protein